MDIQYINLARDEEPPIHTAVAELNILSFSASRYISLGGQLTSRGSEVFQGNEVCHCAIIKFFATQAASMASQQP
jgi:hypothetical protein